MAKGDQFRLSKLVRGTIFGGGPIFVTSQRVETHRTVRVGLQNDLSVDLVTETTRHLAKVRAPTKTLTTYVVACHTKSHEYYILFHKVALARYRGAAAREMHKRGRHTKSEATLLDMCFGHVYLASVLWSAAILASMMLSSWR